MVEFQERTPFKYGKDGILGMFLRSSQPYPSHQTHVMAGIEVLLR